MMMKINEGRRRKPKRDSWCVQKGGDRSSDRVLGKGNMNTCRTEAKEGGR